MADKNKTIEKLEKELKNEKGKKKGGGINPIFLLLVLIGVGFATGRLKLDLEKKQFDIRLSGDSPLFSYSWK